jgi:hypothetical protein
VAFGLFSFVGLGAMNRFTSLKRRFPSRKASVCSVTLSPQFANAPTHAKIQVP